MLVKSWRQSLLLEVSKVKQYFLEFIKSQQVSNLDLELDLGVVVYGNGWQEFEN